MDLKEALLKKLREKKIDEAKFKNFKDIQGYQAIKDFLITQGLLREEEFLKVISKVFGLEYLNLDNRNPDAHLKGVIPRGVLDKYQILPLEVKDDTLVVATSDPFNIQLLEDLKLSINKKRRFVLSPGYQIKRFLREDYSENASLSQIVGEISQETKDVEIMEVEELDVSSALKESERAPIVRIVDLILYEGLKRRASDIHIEPKEDKIKIRYRIDGQLQEAYNLPKRNQNAVIARLKIMSALDITESRIPQDGRFKVKFEGREIDFRVSCLPSIFGEKFVLRALDKTNLSIGLSSLGFSPGPLEIFQKAIKKPFGIILVTGPTGSGKSTTLYSVIQQLNTPDRNIVTIEDPVEYQIEGITQIQIKPEIGLTFAQGLRAILRQSPDIILVGEIRDAETADIAIKASLTGTLILSTLHTNDACGAITRLEDMGIEPFLISSSLILSTAQRLSRRICSKCREPYEVSDLVLKRLNIEFPEGSAKPTFYCGRGCNFCGNTGYRGRIPLLECLEIDDEIREMIIKGASSDDIKEYAVKKKGMHTLRDDALDKCFQGLTTLEEVIRVTSEE